MGVLVIGMHRGGTSALTGLVQLLGFDVGPEAELIGATEANPRGHFELEPLRAFDDDLLAELDARWSAPPVPDDERQRALAAGRWGERAREVFGRLLPGDRWVWKDPRACLLLPFWRAVLGDDDLRVVATVRHPLEVARSLERRDELPVPYALGLWERHQRAAMVGVAGLPTYVVPYDELVERPADAARALGAFLDVDAAQVAAAAEAVGGFVDPGVRHHRATEPLADCADASPEQQALELLVGERTGDQPAWGADLPDETPGLQLAFAAHAAGERWRDLADQLRAGLDGEQERHADEMDRLHADLRTLQEWLDESRAETAHAWSEVRRLDAALADALVGRDALASALERMIVERDGYKWAVLQAEQRPIARARRSVRRALVGDE